MIILEICILYYFYVLEYIVLKVEGSFLEFLVVVIVYVFFGDVFWLCDNCE